MQALFLAAGPGSRLGPLTDTTHKSLLTVGGQTILKMSISKLVALGITEILIVVGHLKEQIREQIDAESLGCNIQYIDNPKYLQFNSFYSFFLGLNGIHGSFICLEADVIYDTSILSALVNFPQNNVISVDSLNLL